MIETGAAPIQISASASEELKQLIQDRSFKEEQYLRIGVKGGGCSGMSYMLGFDNKSDDDVSFSVNGIPCVINKNHLIYLQGLEIDWHNGLDARGFIFNNPNASSTCGCGSSFAV